MSDKPIALGNDDAAIALSEVLAEHLAARGFRVDRYGPATASAAGEDYPDVAVQVAQRVADGTHDRAVLLCGTGIGMAIAANKVPGVRAAQAADTYSAERARKSNDAQVLAIGARTVGPELARAIVDAWLASEYEGGRSASKVAKLVALDGARAAVR
ncbi:RpiB/LacA/LacB family sugar-phosphate isomerase [Pseudonocardia sp. MH-G8]|uniref:RpiB/LacA/LacB family sugar-phosphate isomerase n=1 Tax=Pseudonocardia sp. MH-G8 TaxID=1854588 RepID=UPI000BA07327|nr:RpiB/LacA/LacB family sugar-phosphate isomerase [Pseudonocardia sp. MH-G8]OZM82991.1 ribose-5-phosphate isomerase [Pseudonocardia sp. MH-G8]